MPLWFGISAAGLIWPIFLKMRGTDLSSSMTTAIAECWKTFWLPIGFIGPRFQQDGATAHLANKAMEI